MSHLISIEVTAKSAKKALEDINKNMEICYSSDEMPEPYVLEFERAIRQALERDDG